MVHVFLCFVLDVGCSLCGTKATKAAGVFETSAGNSAGCFFLHHQKSVGASVPVFQMRKSDRIIVYVECVNRKLLCGWESGSVSNVNVCYSEKKYYLASGGWRRVQRQRIYVFTYRKIF